jgi:hypothetical protein
MSQMSKEIALLEYGSGNDAHSQSANLKVIIITNTSELA